VDFGVLEKLRYAGDAYLWKCFAKVSELHVVRGLIGGFRIHRGQISERLGEYRMELRSFSRPPSVLERMQCVPERVLWHVPERVKFVVNRPMLILYDHDRQAWQLGKTAAA
jgi:hypothetical protein